MTLQMYARRKKWELQVVDVHLSHEKIHAEDCECDLKGDKKGRLDKVNRSIEIEGDLTEEQRGRLIKIANLCPVHKTLESEVLVVTGVIVIRPDDNRLSIIANLETSWTPSFFIFIKAGKIKRIDMFMLCPVCRLIVFRANLVANFHHMMSSNMLFDELS